MFKMSNETQKVSVSSSLLDTGIQRYSLGKGWVDNG